MGRKDYYLILGIPRGESPDAIRSAYRDLAHRYHPDRAGAEETCRFQEINEAYEVLSDPTQRAAYDRNTAPPAPRPGRPAQPGPSPEPMIPGDISVLRDPGVTRPSADALYHRFMRDPGRYDLPRSGRVEPLTVELRLDPEQARRGGVVALAVPASRPCPACGGTGRSWALGCLHCGGTGLLERQLPVRVALPPRLRDRELFHLPLRQHGIRNLLLQLLIRVDRA
jgi:DnaJ-class molecular chaperone